MNNLDIWTEALQRHWFRFSECLAISAEQKDNLFQILLKAYSEPQRFYHTAQHIVECLDLHLQIQYLLKEPHLVELAIWFHDVIYDPKSNQNEQNSADLMQDLCHTFLDKFALKKVYLWILATKEHVASSDHDLNYLIDIDLAILGADASRFLQYEQQIQQEYSWVSAEIYKVKRAEVLQNFLNQSSIYITLTFQQSLEQQAKLNLEKLLA